MEPLQLQSGDDTPAVILDQANARFEISGRSLPEDSVTFYQPIKDWIKEYGKQPNATTDFTFKLDYFNTASSKLVLDLLQLLKDVKGIHITWYSRDDDEEIQEAGKEFAEQVDIPFDFKSY